MILVTGAAGKTGLAVIKAIASKGTSVRAMIHRAEQRAVVLEAGASEVTVGNLEDSAAIKTALDGTMGAYLICPNVHPREFEIGKKFIEAAKSSKLNKLMYHSVLYPQVKAMPHHWQKLQIEEALIQSGLNFTILQPASYMQNVGTSWEAIKQTGVLSVPYSVDAKFSMIDLRDVAEIPLMAFARTAFDNSTYQLAGPTALSTVQIAEQISKYLGRPIEARQQVLKDWQSNAKAQGMAQYPLYALSKMFVHYDLHGLQASPMVTHSLLGRMPTAFSEYLQTLKK
jgi:NAD(P)H dehydrogenase (quinone)